MRLERVNDKDRGHRGQDGAGRIEQKEKDRQRKGESRLG